MSSAQSLISDRERTWLTWFFIIILLAFAMLGPYQLYVLRRPSKAGGPVVIMAYSVISVAGACLLFWAERKHRQERRTGVHLLPGDDT